MPRSLLRQNDETIKALIFGGKGNMACLSDLSRATGIPKSSLSRIKDNAGGMKLRTFCKIVKARRLDDETILMIIKGYAL